MAKLLFFILLYAISLYCHILPGATFIFLASVFAGSFVLYYWIIYFIYPSCEGGVNMIELHGGAVEI
ncbi:MAG: hypothetical protein SO146_08010, partial [Eubacteriales bacterium]|nr:hypothetical protein [Eubacteriales bacterium]